MLRGSVEREVAAPPDVVFAAVTDVDRLPEWNALIVRVVDGPAALVEGAVWRVELKLPKVPSWVSRSTVLELDRAARRFRYRSQTDDGNPSYGDWEWHVAAAPAGGSRVTVTWDLHPQTLLRRVLLSRIRNRALRKEVPASIEALASVAARGVS